ncbi:OsmC family protein [Streptomyces nigra]|uniref:OsmC family protein n=1 Tax=Streptomyces nigra TaxID=1827580 RepID=UPI00382A11E5
MRVRGHVLTVDQPRPDGGKDTAPTPVELFVASVASCTPHYAGRYLDRHGLSRDGLAVRADFRMADDSPPTGRLPVTDRRYPLPARGAAGRAARGGLALHGEQHTGRRSRHAGSRPMRAGTRGDATGRGTRARRGGPTRAADGDGVPTLSDFERAPPGRVDDGTGQHVCSHVGFHHLLDRAAR